MADKITIIKVGSSEYIPSQIDLERWRTLLNDRNIKVSHINIMSDGDVEAQDLDIAPKVGSVLVVRVGPSPTQDELQRWREVFLEAKNDSEFKIFTHSGVTFERIDIGLDPVVE